MSQAGRNLKVKMSLFVPSKQREPALSFSCPGDRNFASKWAKVSGRRLRRDGIEIGRSSSSTPTVFLFFDGILSSLEGVAAFDLH